MNGLLTLVCIVAIYLPVMLIFAALKSGGLVLDFIVTALGITGQIKPVLYVIKQIPLVYYESPGVVRGVRENVIEDITAGSGYGYEDGMDD